MTSESSSLARTANNAARQLAHQAKRALRWLRKPTLSVIIPAYNSEASIETAVRSALNQGIADLEVIVVDDASTDKTLQVAQLLAERDPRVRTLATGTNSGPGRARNLGIDAARGRFLTFIDADDRALPDVYPRMLATITESGSDFISGGYIRTGETGTHRPDITRRVHAATLIATNLTEFSDVLHEPVLWNKIYRTRFWRDRVGPIPEDRNYEDQEPALRAAVRANTFDVVDYDVYAWALPEQRETRSQSKRTAHDLESRVKVVRALATLSDEMPPRARQEMGATLLGRDLTMYLREVPYTSDEYWETLHNVIKAVWHKCDGATISLIPCSERVLAYAGAHGTRSDVESLVAGLDQHGTTVKWTRVDGHWTASLPWIDRSQHRLIRTSHGTPSLLWRHGPNDWTVAHRTWSADWATEGELRVTGFATIPGVEPTNWSRRALNLLTDTGDVLWTADLPLEDSEWVDVEVADSWTTHNQAAFTARVPAPRHVEGELALNVSIEIDGVTHQTMLNFPASEKSPIQADGLDLSVSAARSPKGTLVIRPASKGPLQGGVPEATERELTLDHVYLNGDFAVLSGPLRDREQPANTLGVVLISSATHVGLPLKVDGSRWSAQIDLGDPRIPSGGMFLKWRDSAEPPEPGGWKDVCSLRSLITPPALRIVGPSRAVSITRHAGTSTGLTLGPPLTNSERSRFGRQRLSEQPAHPLMDAIVFDTFTGKPPGDNPLAVFEQLSSGTLDPQIESALPKDCEDWPRYWSLIDGTMPVPSGATPVFVGSREWFEVARSARLLITNNNLPPWFNKSEGQFWLQTWHGTPMKRLLLDAPRSATSAIYRALMSRQVPQWDLLLAQDHKAEENLRSSTGYSGQSLVVEQPRNARLFEPGLRQETRKLLGIDENARVILYAPTWRQADATPSGTRSYLLDPGWLADRTDAIVLVRTHHMTNLKVGSVDRVRDVSDGWRVEDLMVASDLLISDYSSIFFDYALLDKPMIAYAPDLDTYAGRDRGFYREWRQGVPVVRGPAGFDRTVSKCRT